MLLPLQEDKVFGDINNTGENKNQNGLRGVGKMAQEDDSAVVASVRFSSVAYF